MLAGLLLGVVIGLLVGPVLRSWITWREYTNASREARLVEETLRLMGEEKESGNPGEPLAPARGSR